jgi:hypothetical protein
MHSDDPSWSDKKLQVDEAILWEGPFRFVVVSWADCHDIELEVLAIVVEVEILLRTPEFTEGAWVEAEEPCEPLKALAVTATEVDPEQVALAQILDALLIQRYLPVMPVGIIEISVETTFRGCLG